MPAIEIAVEFTMRGTTAAGDYVTWHVYRHPDFEARQAPQPMEPGSVTIKHTFDSAWQCLECETRIESKLDHERDREACDLEKVRRVMES